MSADFTTVKIFETLNVANSIDKANCLPNVKIADWPIETTDNEIDAPNLSDTDYISNSDKIVEATNNNESETRPKLCKEQYIRAEMKKESYSDYLKALSSLTSNNIIQKIGIIKILTTEDYLAPVRD